MAIYRSPEQRETIIWLCSLREKMEQETEHWKSNKRKLIATEIIPQLEKWCGLLMEGINNKEGQAIIQLARRVRPVLIATDFTRDELDETLTASSDDIYDLAELALEHCRYNVMVRDIRKMTNAVKIKQYLKDNFKCSDCDDPEECKYRKVFLNFLVPALTEDGKCQYWRGSNNENQSAGH